MEYRVNFHTHTDRCKHAQGTEEDYVKSAIDNRLEKLGFSDHGPFPDGRFGLRMDYNELSEYINSIKKLSEKYKDKIKLVIGLEIEYYDQFNDYYKSLLNELDVEYLILGQHIYKDNYEYVNVFYLNNTNQYISYAKEVYKAVKSGFFKIVAHPDVIFINNLPWDDNCEKSCNILIEAAKKYDIALELNANGFRRGIYTYEDGDRYPYPHIKFWEKVAKTNIRVIISSDCHNPKDVWDTDMSRTYKFAEELKLNIIRDI